MSEIIAIANQKGGVGKTTTTFSLGVALRKQGNKVLLIDADPQGDLTTCMGYYDQDKLQNTIATLMSDTIYDNEINAEKAILHHKEGIDLIPANLDLSAIEFSLVNAMSREFTLKNSIRDIKDNYDYILIDCMPSLGMITINALACSDKIIIPVQGEYLAAKGMGHLLKTVSRIHKQINPNLKIGGVLLTNQSVPDFDKILPLCEALGLTTEELITGEKEEKNAEIEEIKKEKERAKKEYMQKRNKKKAIVLSISIFLYCIATFALPYMTEVLRYEDAHAVMIWATLCTIATVIIVYFFVAYPNMYKEEKENKGIKDDIEELNDEIEEIEKLDDGRIKIEAVGAESKTEALAIQIVASLFLIIYLLVSFLTGAWHITWILWIVFIFVELIVKLIFSMKGEKENNEK